MGGSAGSGQNSQFVETVPAETAALFERAFFASSEASRAGFSNLLGQDLVGLNAAAYFFIIMPSFIMPACIFIICLHFASCIMAS